MRLSDSGEALLKKFGQKERMISGKDGHFYVIVASWGRYTLVPDEEHAVI
jgi:hypothetical protein